MTQIDQVLTRVHQALGRAAPLTAPPIPPEIDDSITRLVAGDARLAELFTLRAEENKIHVRATTERQLAGELAAFLRESRCRRLALPDSPELERLRLVDSLGTAGFEARRWSELSLDQVYDFDCGITDVYCAVAETGSLVVRATPAHGRALSLVPAVHVAIVHREQIIPDLIDLFNKLPADGLTSSTVIITGPSKTADIEMSLVVGVHGPGIVQVFLI